MSRIFCRCQRKGKPHIWKPDGVEHIPLVGSRTLRKWASRETERNLGHAWDIPWVWRSQLASGLHHWSCFPLGFDRRQIQADWRSLITLMQSYFPMLYPTTWPSFSLAPWLWTLLVFGICSFEAFHPTPWSLYRPANHSAQTHLLPPLQWWGQLAQAGWYAPSAWLQSWLCDSRWARELPQTDMVGRGPLS